MRIPINDFCIHYFLARFIVVSLIFLALFSICLTDNTRGVRLCGQNDDHQLNGFWAD